MAPLLQAVSSHPQLESKVAVTAQQVLRLFEIVPDYDLNLMKQGQTLSDITCAVLKGLDEILTKEQPDILLVHGDTTTTCAAALAGYYHQVPVGHVEAGLRSGDKYAPYPEEINRKLSGAIAAVHFAPTDCARENLLREGVADEQIFITGNTVIDALLQTVDKPCDLADVGLSDVDWSKKVILMTCHRRENWGRPMEEIFAAAKTVLEECLDAQIVLPVHKNPLVREIAHRQLDGAERVHFCEPLDYLPFCHVMKKSYLVLTDSGGLQEEAPALGKPVLVLRDVTERPEAIAAGTARLVGCSYDSVRSNCLELLTDKTAYAKMAHAANPYGDGKSSQRIAKIIAGLSADMLRR